MEKLRQILTQDDTVLFIGSGVSQWSGLPSWIGLLNELITYVEASGGKTDLIRSEAQRGELLQAASYGFDKLTKHQVGDFIRRACRVGKAKPHEIHQKIVTLGPRCFVTTNYDNLVEESLRLWQPTRFFRPPVTNRMLTETAEVVHSRAIDFVFKPHGDANDSDSIILTREQYRQLLPGGERQAALESLKTLLVSRPIVYIGFGLRDPDFLYLRDILANTYKGGVRDHYAIMADISADEIDYWRRNYGIHIVSYTTLQNGETRSHSPLLDLLDSLHEHKVEASIPNEFKPRAPSVLLACARYAASLSLTQKLPVELQIRVHAERSRTTGGSIYYRRDKHDNVPVADFLENGPERALLIGLPGAGKTYSISRGVARLAEKLHQSCLSESLDESPLAIPIFADLKLYRGDLNQLVRQSLPKSLPLDDLLRFFRVKIYLDSFNEMPREYWESGSYEADFDKFIKEIGNASLIIGSRTIDGLKKLNFQVYCLDEIDESAVNTELLRLGVGLEGRFHQEVRSLLQRPFYFQYLTSGKVRLRNDAHPRDFYRSLFSSVSDAFETRFSVQFDIEKALSLAAYDSLNGGEEAFQLIGFTQSLKVSLEMASAAEIDARDVANWLVSVSLLIPHTGGRVAFVHQSVTEYLASSELARRYLENPRILKEKLTLTRWDQALFLALSVLPPDQAENFLKDVINADFPLALNAAKYLETGRDEIVSKLLREAPERISASGPYDWNIPSALQYNLPISPLHEPLLWDLVRCGNALGAAASVRLVEIKGAQVKDELLRILFENPDDYNLCCNGIAPALRPFATKEDVHKVVALINSMEAMEPRGSDDNDDCRVGFTSGASAFLENLDLALICKEFLPAGKSTPIGPIRTKVFCEILREHHTTEALELAGSILLMGYSSAAWTIYCIAEFGETESKLSWDSYTEAHIQQLRRILREVEESWALNALHCVCLARPDLAAFVKQLASQSAGIEKAALLFCNSSTDQKPVFDALKELTEFSGEKLATAPVHILRKLELDWTDKEALFVQLLKRRDTRLAYALFGGVSPPTVKNLGILDIGPIQWWLDWMLEITASDTNSWVAEQMGGLFGQHLPAKTQKEFIAEINTEDSKYRRLLFLHVLTYFKELTTSDLNEGSISFMLADLSTENRAMSFHGHLLGNIATEQFIAEKILPLLPEAKKPLLDNLYTVLRQAGSRHGRRYVTQ